MSLANIPFNSNTSFDNCFFLPRKSDISRYLFDDVTVLYHKGSGNTHMLNFLATAILDILLMEKGDFKLLVARVRQVISLSEEDCPDHLIFSTLVELEKSGLIACRIGAGSAQDRN